MTPTKIYITTVGENEITVSINGEAAVTKTVKPTLTAIGNSKIRFQCDDIDETVLTYLYIIINGAPLKGSWIGEEDYLSVALFEAIMNKTFTSSGTPGGGSSYLVKTCAELVALIAGDGLVAGTQYEISDFRTVHYIADGNGNQYLDTIITGDLEPLIVTAVSNNKLDKVAKSTVYPQDIIYLDLDENNWLDDLSFADLSGAPVIVTGWKGTIYFRHDTLLDNYMGYDFRNCKFRRWKTNQAAWSDATEYSGGNYVTYSGFIYQSIQDANTDNQPDVSPTFWNRLFDLSRQEYLNAANNIWEGITTNNAEFDDFKTFAEGAGSATYDICCKSNHFASYKDDNTFYDIAGTILSNNVFFLEDEDSLTVYVNEIGAENFGNTICGYFSQNTIGNYFYANIIGGDFKWNNILNDFDGNKVMSGTYNNLGERFFHNSTSDTFNNNTFGARATSNLMGSGFTDNTIQGQFSGNRLTANFKNVSVLSKVQNQQLAGATLIYDGNPKELISDVSGVGWVRYIDAMGDQQIVAATT